MPKALKKELAVAIQQTGGYLMIESLHVENFRCFKSLELHGLKRVNVIVGKNAAGKTALLEAMRLALGGTPHSLFSLNQLRSQVFYLPQPPTREQFEAQFNPYFFNVDPSNTISTECIDSEGRSAKLRVFYDPEKTITPLPMPQFQYVQPVATIVPLAFERTDFAGHTGRLYASVNPQGGGITLEPGPELGLVTEFFPSTWIYNPQQNAIYFSQLSQQNREKEVIEVIKREFDPLIQDLSVLAPNQVPSMYATIPHLREKLPLTLVSAGINKFFSILAAIVTRSHGVVLIDEVENGLYYGKFSSLWEIILRLSFQYNTQVFTSTHSLECVHALLASIKGHEDEFTLLRVERENGFSGITSVKGQFLEAALEQNFELR